MSDADGSVNRKRPAADATPTAARKRAKLNSPAGFALLAFDAPTTVKATRRPAPSSSAPRATAFPTPSFSPAVPGPSKSALKSRLQPTPVKHDQPQTPKPKRPTKLLQPPKLHTAPATPAVPLRHALPPPLPATPVKQTPKRVLRPPPLPPRFSTPAPEPSKRPLRVLSTPLPVPGPATQDDAHLKPLSTTRLALASTPDGSEDSATFAQSLFASTRDPASDDPEHRALVRGFAPSPEKQPRARRPFVRSALAECVEQYVDRASKALVLWQEEARRHDPRRMDPAMTVVVRAVHARSEHSGAASVPRGVLASCVVREGDAEFSILFTASGEPLRGSAPVDVQPGSRVMIWRPWTELHSSRGGREGMDELSEAVAASSEAFAVLLCSRFVVLR